jgi:cell division protease FtsH
VQRTAKVSAAFIKELMRRAVQFHLEKNQDGQLTLPAVQEALEEMLFHGGSLNVKLLGGASIEMPSAS